MIPFRRPAAAFLALLLLLAACAAPAAPPRAPAEASERPAPAPAVPRPQNAHAERIAVPPPLARSAQPVIEGRLVTALVDDHCVDRDLAAVPATDIILTVLDRTYALPAAYVPPDLVAASAAGLTGGSGTKLVRSVLIADLAAMHDAWVAADLSMIVESAYRSWGDQAATFNTWVARLGYAGALVRSARPGHSEHQLGTAIDITSAGWGGRFGDWARETREGTWMAENAWRHGFVMSYPFGSQAATCFGYEPWHYRWVGREVAAEHRASGLYLRDFLERYVDS